MRKAFRRLMFSVSALTLTALLVLPSTQAADDETKPSEAAIAKGKEIAFDRGKGNCLACHMIQGGEMPGNIGPPLIAMKARFPNRADLRAQIADPRNRNPVTIMPPFEPHGVISSEEVDLVTDYIHTL